MQDQNTTLSRRTFLGGAAALAASSMVPNLAPAAPVAGPDSNFNGVQIGVITYSYRSLPGSAEDLLKYVTQCGISSIELMGGPAEQFAGAPEGKKGRGKALLDWRLSAPMDKFTALRKMYNDAGVNIHIVKFGDIGSDGMPDEQIEYYFQVAKALGATGITREISEAAAKRLGPIADKNKIPYVLTALTRGGTDSGTMQFAKWGVPCLTFVVATRYIHGHVGVLHRDDYDNLVKLLTAIVKKLDAKTVAKLTRG